MHELELLRGPLAFGWAHPNITLSAGGAVASGDEDLRRLHVPGRGEQGGDAVGSTLCTVYCREGDSLILMLGVIRPGWNAEGGADAYNVDGHCFYSTGGGHRYPGWHGWEGMQGASEGDRIGMLLDLDQGSMTVWKNGEKLGVMVAEGLSGPLCWAVSMYGQGYSARIESVAMPQE